MAWAALLTSEVAAVLEVREKKLSSILETSTLATATLVEVAMTYFWLTLRRGIPLAEKGPDD